MAIVSAELGDAALAAQFYGNCVALNQDLAHFRFADGLEATGGVHRSVRYEDPLA